MNSKALSLISISKKAGKVLIGKENLMGAANSGKLWLMVLAADAAKDSRKTAEKLSAQGITAVETEFSKTQLGGSIGFKEAALVGITDKGLAQAIEEHCKDTEEKA